MKPEGNQTVKGGVTGQSTGPRRLPRYGPRRLGISLKRLSPDERNRIVNELYLAEGADFLAYLFRYGVLLALSTIIAGFGLIAGSTAVVIGAMLIAPMMEPILAASAALAMG